MSSGLGIIPTINHIIPTNSEWKWWKGVKGVLLSNERLEKPSKFQRSFLSARVRYTHNYFYLIYNFLPTIASKQRGANINKMKVESYFDNTEEKQHGSNNESFVEIRSIR